LHKKLAAILTIAIFAISTLAITNPVQATYTLGLNTPTGIINNYDGTRVPGFIGYVWPGGGSDSYSGAFSLAAPDANVNANGGFSPGYVPPNPLLPPASGAMVCNGKTCPESWYQLSGNAYSPFGAVLAGSTGDLIFAINDTYANAKATMGFDGLTILIPPEFKIPGSAQISDTWSNDHNQIYTYTLAPDDRYAPGWTAVTLWVDGYNGHFYNGKGTTNQYVSHHQFLNFTNAKEWYYARINGVTAPTIAGKYFFKMLLIGDDGGAPGTYFNATQFVPVQNWPVMLVKGELDPAIMTGTVTYGGFNATMYGQPIDMAGRVWAEMTTKLDPYTGATVATCPPESDPGVPSGGAAAVPGCTDAVGYFNETAHGLYYVEGVAPGIYNIYAEAAGYPQMLEMSGVTILRGQSLHFPLLLQPGPVIHGNVYSKHQFGDEPWPGNSTTTAYEGFDQYMKIELYANPTLGNKVDPSAGAPVSWSPLPCIAGGQAPTANPWGQGGNPYYDDSPAGGYDIASGTDASVCGNAATASNIGFPWARYGPTAGSAEQQLLALEGIPGGFPGWSSVQLSQPEVCTSYPCARSSTTDNQDPEGVGPPQQWVVAGGTTTPFHFEFGVKGEFGAPRDIDAHVPQVYATWVNGLTAGRYYVRAWTFRYVQTGLDGATFQEYYFDVTPNEWAGDVTLPIDLRLSSWVNKTVHFHDAYGLISTFPVRTGSTYLDSYLQGADGHVYAFNYTNMGSYATSTAPYVNKANPGGRWCQAFSTGNCVVQLWGINSTWIGENYGIPSGTYSTIAGATGYAELPGPSQVSVTLSGNPTQVSDHLYLGPGFNVTLYSIDWERPTVPRNWLYPGLPIQVGAWVNGTSLASVWDPKLTGAQTRLVCDNPTPVQNNNQPYVPLLSSGGCGLGIPDPMVTDGWYGSGGNGWTGGTVGENGPWLTSDTPSDSLFTGEMPTYFTPGLYTFTGTTYGYIQDQTFSVYASWGQLADIKINLVIGVNVSLSILFKKEGVITPTNGNMSARVRLFDDAGKLVADYMTSEGVYSQNVTKNGGPLPSGNAVAADGKLQPTASGGPFPDTKDFTAAGYPGFDDYAAGHTYTNYLPGGVTFFRVQLAGRAMVFNAFEGTYPIDPVFGPADSSESGGVLASGTTNAGIPGASDYTGGWTAEVDFVPLYMNNTAGVGEYYPPVTGLLMGESYHIIPGTTATSGISYTEDGALSILKSSMAPNHLGPYSQEGTWQIAGTHNSGEASAIFEVDLNGFISGDVFAMNYLNEWRTTSWYGVTAAAASGTGSWNFYTYDGMYQAFLPPGSYSFTIAGPGVASQTLALVVSAGESSSAANVYLQQSQVPVPEFSGLAIVAFAALAASVYLLRRRRK